MFVNREEIPVYPLYRDPVSLLLTKYILLDSILFFPFAFLLMARC